MFDGLINFASSFKNLANIILTGIGGVAAAVSFIPVPMPAWLMYTLRVVGIAAPAAGCIISIVKFFKDRKKMVSPSHLGEALTSSNRDFGVNNNVKREYSRLVDDVAKDYCNGVEDAVDAMKNNNSRRVRAYTDLGIYANYNNSVSENADRLTCNDIAYGAIHTAGSRLVGA